MKKFQFPLQKVLQWREAQLKAEELKYQRAMAAVGDLESTRKQLAVAVSEAETATRCLTPALGSDLGALDRYRQASRVRESELRSRQTECERAAAEQKAVLMEAQRRCRLLERLKERRLVEWTAARDRELEEAATEVYLAQWGRG